MPVSASPIKNVAAPEDPALTAAFDAAQRLTASDVIDVVRAGNSGNNRLYKITTANGIFALKSYPSFGQDPRDRLGTEFGALRFLRDQGIRDVPKAYEAEKESGFALYEWVEGTLAKPQNEGDIDQVLDFITRILPLRNAKGADQLKPASEAVFAPQDVVEQVNGRLAKLEQAAAHYPNLATYLKDGFRPLFAGVQAWSEKGYAAAKLDFKAPVAASVRILNPSDFGYHNALRQADGKLVFIDFEYFGWDDPVKLTCDFVQHPGMDLTDAEKQRFLDGMATLCQSDATYPVRLEFIYPLMGLRWCMILLNEFLKDRLARRQFAGAVDDAEVAQARQLEKARHWAKRVETYIEERKG